MEQDDVASRSFGRSLWPWVVVLAGWTWATVSVLDPGRPLGRTLGPALGLAGVALAARFGRLTRALAVGATLAAANGLAATVEPSLGADSISYYAYLRSSFFDRDLDFTNEWQAWGHEPPAMTDTGLRRNVHSVGPAVVWSPFFLAAHLYVVLDGAPGHGRYGADGYSLPYYRAATLGTLTAVVAGGWLLVSTLAARFGAPIAGLAGLAAVLGSPVIYYALHSPMMAHGAAFGAAAALLWAWDRARRAPSLGAWCLLGACLGLATLMRWQALVLLLLVLPLALHGLAMRRLRPGWLAAGGVAALAVFAPQLIAWRRIFGRLVTLPQGAGFMDWSSPHLVDVLLSADHGLFTWTPLMLLGLVGLAGGVRQDPLLHLGGLAVFAATAWVNGGVRDWAAGDAFGARRFDLVVPLLAVGIARAVAALASLARRAPLLAPATLLAVAIAWNLGFAGLFREGRHRGSAPLDRLAADQARLLRLAAESVAERLGGPRARALAYKVFSAEYLYTGFNAGGTLEPASMDERDLRGAWSPPRRKPGEPACRWVLGQEACVRIPLEAPFDWSAAITARAAPGSGPRSMLVLVNAQAVASADITAEWSETRVVVPGRFQVPGENWLCLRFAGPTPEDGVARAAVARVQLP